MPIIRYLVFASAFVAALLFALDRSLPPLSDVSAGAGVDRSVIRIHSARALPEKIILDTSTMVAVEASAQLLIPDASSRAASQALTTPESLGPTSEIAHNPRLSPSHATGGRSSRTAASSASPRSTIVE
ncbi:hypothetical protein [Bradyrhizobium sp. MOS003]|jgi:hypothetical protein|uniref:hypothetical protein n=1 Tax=Bradyrhizobium sp. MOS003 TaxID=2133946 RepID=UPI000D128C59|nr:hypothetical protein [Bradyrhizobium sp. MOS003]